MSDAIRCGCQRSLAVICAAFASAAAIAFFAEDRCLDVGGRLSDSAWSCESAAGVIDSLWSLVTPQMFLLAAAIAGVPVYFIVRAIAVRWIFADRNAAQ
jgi:hypothetical protein